MPKYCPICQGEFKKQMDICPVDNVLLTDKPVVETKAVYVDIYAASGEIEAERITVFLDDDGIVAKESTQGIAQLPVLSDTRFIIAVPREDAKKARNIIEQARKDGVISQDGSFL